MYNTCTGVLHTMHLQRVCNTLNAYNTYNIYTGTIHTKAYNTYETLSQHKTYTHYIKTRQTCNTYTVPHNTCPNTQYIYYVCTVHIHSMYTHMTSYQYSLHVCLSHHTHDLQIPNLKLPYTCTAHHTPPFSIHSITYTQRTAHAQVVCAQAQV